MAKVTASYRLDEPVKQVVETLAGYYSLEGRKFSTADVVQLLILRDALEKLDKGYLEDTFGVEAQHLLQVFTNAKW